MPGIERSGAGSYGSRFQYQGEHAEFDEETSFNFFELRAWDPVIGRWMAPDPARQYASPYLGMGNNPANGVDPDGGWDKYFDKQTGELVHDTGVGDNAYIAHYDDDGNLLLGQGFIGSLSEMIGDPRSLEFGIELFKMIEEFSSMKNNFSNSISKNSYFASRVGTGKRYDFKNRKGTIWDESTINGRKLGIWNNRLMKPDDWGNYAYGVGARAFGFSEGWSVFGAGIAQLGFGIANGMEVSRVSTGDIKGYPTLNLNQRFYNIGWTNFSGWFDNARDTHLIRHGYNNF